MSKKVIVTKAQEKELNEFMDKWSRKDLLYTHTIKMAEKSSWIIRPELNAFSLEDMANIVTFGFESKHEYKPEDWVTRVNEREPVLGPTGNRKQGSIFQVARVRSQGIKDTEGQTHEFINIRPATPEEIKVEIGRKRLDDKFLSIGRIPGEFIEGDVGVHESGNIHNNLYNIKHHYKGGKLLGFYPAEALIKFEGNDTNE